MLGVMIFTMMPHSMHFCLLSFVNCHCCWVYYTGSWCLNDWYIHFFLLWALKWLHYLSVLSSSPKDCCRILHVSSPVGKGQSRLRVVWRLSILNDLILIKQILYYLIYGSVFFPWYAWLVWSTNIPCLIQKILTYVSFLAKEVVRALPNMPWYLTINAFKQNMEHLRQSQRNIFKWGHYCTIWPASQAPGCFYKNFFKNVKSL